MKESFKNYVFRVMEEKGYCCDQDVANYSKNEDYYGFYEADQHVRLWKKLQYFKDFNFTEIAKGNRVYLARTEEMEKDSWHKIPKELYIELSNKLYDTNTKNN